jgi:alpha-L-fucosidase 2
MKLAKRLLSVCVSALLAAPCVVYSPKSTDIAVLAAEEYSYDEDLVMRYDTMAGNVSTNNAFNNDESFYRALPVGNGRIGGMVYGNCPDELIDLNECTVWSSGPSNNNKEGAASYLKQAQQLLLSGKYKEANDLIGSKMIGGGEAKYQMVGGLKLSLGHKDVTGYSRTLDMNDAVAKTTYSCGGTKYTRETFVSYPDQVMVTRITCDKPGALSMSVGYENILNGGAATDGNDTLVANGHGSDDNWVKGAVYFSTRTKVIPESGSVSAGNGKVNVTGADSVMILTSVRTNYVDYKTCNGDEKGDAAKDIAKAEKLSYDTLYSNHKADYQKLFKRVDVDLGGDSSVTNSKTVNARISEFGRTDDPKMVKTLFQYGRYLMISASRDAQPMNLQGIWNKYSSPAWGSKATTNINYEMNYWPALTTNLEECFTPFVNKALELQYAGNETAKVHYGIDKGWVLHHNTDLWNRTAPIDGTWGLWPVGGAWVSNMLYDAYRFNQNETYLEKVYPVIKGSAEFLNELMTPAKINGQEYMVINPSTSPEINLPPYSGPNEAYCDYSVTMDNGITRELFKGVTEASEILDKDSSLRSDLNSKLSLIRPETIGKWGQIQEWAQDWDNPNEKHRHISHMYALYPGYEITPTDNPTTAKAAATSLNGRGDDGTGWSEAWKLNCWARLEDGEHAYKLVKLLISPVSGGGRLYDNLWDAHPPFQIDGNFGFTSGVAEMLLQSQNDVITLLPAIPSKWSTGHANGLRARGNFEIKEMSWSNGDLDSVTVLSNSGGTCTLRYGGTVISFETEAGKEYSLGGDLQFTGDTNELQNVALGKKATCSGSEDDETAALAFDGKDSTKWCHMDGLSGEWIQVDLGDEYDIRRWVLKFAGVKEDIKYNARDFKIEGSTDGTSWTDIDTVYGNTKTVCGQTIAPVSARYVKLTMLTSTQSNDGGARLYEFEVYGADNKPAVPKTAYTIMDGSTFSFKHGGIKKGEDNSSEIGYITDGCYAVYRNLDFETGPEGFKVKASSASDGGTIEIRTGGVNGTLLGTCEITGTDDWSEYKEFSCATKQCEGVKDLYLVFKGDDGYLFNVESFSFYGIKGDTSCDRTLNGFDMAIARKAALKSVELTGLALSNADINSDDEISVADMLLLQKYLLGKSKTL